MTKGGRVKIQTQVFLTLKDKERPLDKNQELRVVRNRVHERKYRSW